MKILIVEDSPQDRELLIAMLETRFQQEAKFREASDLGTAIRMLRSNKYDIIVLDLTLPDSVGKETFQKLYAQFSDIPIIVMTNHKDRSLAMDLIKEGAADYIMKNFTNEEELFSRIMFAVERHKSTIRVPEEASVAVRELDKSRSLLREAHQSGQHTVAVGLNHETTEALARITSQMFGELQKVGLSIQELKVRVEQFDDVYTEVFKGHPDRPSLKSSVELLAHRTAQIESKLTEERRAEEQERNEDRKTDLELHKLVVDNRTRVIVTVLTVVGTILTTILGGYVASRSITAPSTPAPVVTSTK